MKKISKRVYLLKADVCLQGTGGGGGQGGQMLWKCEVLLVNQAEHLLPRKHRGNFLYDLDGPNRHKSKHLMVRYKHE